MRSLVRGPWVMSRLRAALLAGIALAAVADLVTFAAVVGDGDTGPGPDDVAREVIGAVADDDCSAIDGLVADDADLPASLVRCLSGAPGTADLSDVRVLTTSTTGDTSAVVVGVAADGLASQVVVDLRRDDDRWRVTGVRPAG